MVPCRVFFHTRMFSYSTFLVSTSLSGTKLQNIATINDKDIIPTTGVNPFAVNGVTLSGNTNTYEVYITPKGDQGNTNEIKYTVDCEYRLID